MSVLTGRIGRWIQSLAIVAAVGHCRSYPDSAGTVDGVAAGLAAADRLAFPPF